MSNVAQAQPVGVGTKKSNASASSGKQDALAKQALLEKFSGMAAEQVSMQDVHELVAHGLCLMEGPSIKQDESMLYKAAKGNKAFRFYCTSSPNANYVARYKAPRDALLASLRAGVLRDCVFPPVVIWELMKIKGW